MARKPKADALPHRRFLAQLRALSRGRTALDYQLPPSARDYLTASAGSGGLSFRYVVGRDRCRVELFIAGRAASANKNIFDGLSSHKSEIVADFGGPLSWERLEGSKSCRVASRAFRNPGGVGDAEARWQTIQEELVNAMARLEKALRPWIDAPRS